MDAKASPSLAISRYDAHEDRVCAGINQLSARSKVEQTAPPKGVCTYHHPTLSAEYEKVASGKYQERISNNAAIRTQRSNYLHAPGVTSGTT